MPELPSAEPYSQSGHFQRPAGTRPEALIDSLVDRRGPISDGANDVNKYPDVSTRTNSRRTSIIIVSLGLISVSHLLPTAIGALIAFLGLVGGFSLWLQDRTVSTQSRRGYWPVVFALAVISFWSIGLTNSNVPTLSIGIDGLRKSAFAAAGVAWGCAAFGPGRRSVERAVIIILNILLATSLVSFLWFPDLFSHTTNAAVYTSLFEGEERLQGVFSGPFHVALAALVCIGWSIVRYRSDPFLAFTSAILGLLGGYLSLVRTVYPALALMLFAFIILSPTVRVALRRLFIFGAAIFALGVSTFLFPSLGNVGRIASTIGDLQDDERFTNRFPGYKTSLRLFQDSPVYGWGPGSAGDTLRFPSGYEHVTAHNVALKFLVEGGLVGLLFWIALIAAIVFCLKKRAPESQIAILSLLSLIGLGMTVSAIDALPVSFLIFVLCGLACESQSSRRVRSARAAVPRTAS